MRFRRRSDDPLWKKAKRGYRGNPVLVVAFYGPDDQLATKATIGLRAHRDADAEILESIVSTSGDVRQDPAIRQRILNHFHATGAKSVAMARSILGCPHEEGIDFAEGTACPECPFWAGRDHFAVFRAETLARSLAASLFEGRREPVPSDDEDEDGQAADEEDGPNLSGPA